MATQKDVAKLANVSFITVSRVINNMGNVKEETRTRVKAAIKELNYYPNSIAQGLNRNRVNTLAIQAPVPSYVSVEETSYYRRLLIGIEKYCIGNNYDILLSTQRGKADNFDYLRPFYERKADGIAFLGAKPTEEQFEKILKDKIPCVIIGDRDPNLKVNYIDTENLQGMYNATEYLIKKGHTKISFLRSNFFTQNSSERFSGFAAAMNEKGLKIREEWLFPGDFTKESGKEAIHTILALKNRPTALICCTDLMAIGAYEEAKDQNLNIPKDLSIFGFDGHEICSYTSPPLATMRQPLEKMGEEAARLLINQIQNENSEPQHLIFPVDLQPGGSVLDLRGK